MSIGKRLGLLVVLMLGLFLLLAAATIYTVTGIGHSVDGYAVSVREGNAAKQTEAAVYELQSLSTEFLNSRRAKVAERFTKQAAELDKQLLEWANSTEDVERVKYIREAEGLLKNYIQAFEELVQLTDKATSLNEQQLQPRLADFEKEIQNSLESARDQGDIGASFQASSALQYLAQSQAALYLFLSNSEDKDAQRAETAFAAMVKELDQMVKGMEELAEFDATMVDAAKLQRLQKAASEARAAQKVIGQLREGVMAIQKSSQSGVEAIAPKMVATIQQLEQDLDNYQASLAQAAAKSQASARWLTLVLTSAGLIGGIGLSVFLGLGITRKISSVSDRLEMSAHETKEASVQILASSHSLAEGANEQAASLEETSASLEEMSGMTARNAERANEAKDLATATRGAAEKGATDMQEMTEAMTAIKDSSNNIAKIIRTIDEIAFQTNLLALNAAVEAARAGESGAGFAVVADEVRSLAHRSAEAARETAAKIEDSLRKSDRGVQICQTVAQSLSGIVERARSMDQVVVEIANSSQEQSTGIAQIERAISEIDSLTQRNAASAEENASSAQMLNQQALAMESAVTDLLGLVGRKSRSQIEEEEGVGASVTTFTQGSGKMVHPKPGTVPVAKPALKSPIKSPVKSPSMFSSGPGAAAPALFTSHENGHGNGSGFHFSEETNLDSPGPEKPDGEPPELTFR